MQYTDRTVAKEWLEHRCKRHGKEMPEGERLEVGIDLVLGKHPKIFSEEAARRNAALLEVVGQIDWEDE